MITQESWEKFCLALKKMKMSIRIQHETKKLAEILAKSVKKCIYTCMFPMEPMEKLASISVSFKKNLKGIHFCDVISSFEGPSRNFGQLGPVW